MKREQFVRKCKVGILCLVEKEKAITQFESIGSAWLYLPIERPSFHRSPLNQKRNSQGLELLKGSGASRFDLRSFGEAMAELGA